MPLLVVLAGTAALAVREPGTWTFLVVVFVGVAGLLLPGATGTRHSGAWTFSVVAGVAAFALVRGVWAGPAIPLTLAGVGVSAAAAVGEEAFFRRGAYAWLERWGPAVAVAATALAFAFVHGPSYGWGAFPLNLGAGMLLGWQRWATGGWTAPATTHVAANLMQMG